MDEAQAKTRLKERRQELLDIAAASDEARAPVELDQSRVGRLSRMDALQVQAMSLETERRRSQEIRRKVFRGSKSCIFSVSQQPCSGYGYYG